MSSQPSTPREDLRHLFFGFRVSQALYAVAELGIADMFSDEPRSAEDLAADSGVHASSLARVLRLLSSEGVFAETPDGRFVMTPMAEALRSDAPGSMRSQVRAGGRDTIWRSWGQLLRAVQTGEPAFDHVHGVDFFTYHRQHPDEGELFNQVMTSQTAPLTGALAAAYDFLPFKTIVDVGGGRGTLALGLLEAYPHLHAIIFDQPSVVVGAQQAVTAAGMTGNCTVVGGNFFEAVPDGGDALLLKYILHDWDDERCIEILRSCWRATPENGKLLVIELLVPQGNAPSYAKSQDVNMLVNLGGRERSEAEYRQLFAAAGFTLTRTIPVYGELYIIEGIPVGLPAHQT